MKKQVKDITMDLFEFFEVCPLPLFTCNLAGKILNSNKAFLNLISELGVSQEETAKILPEGALSSLQKSIHSTREIFELKNQFKGRFLEFTFAPHRREPIAFVIASDLTEQRRAEQRIQNYAGKLEASNHTIQEAQRRVYQAEKMASLGLLVAGIAHEINTPIGSINCNNDILTRSVGKMQEFLNCDRCPQEVRENPEVVKIMGVLEEISHNNRIACDRILSIIRSLKNFARLDEAERRTVDIHEELDNSLVLVHHQLKNRIQVVKKYGDVPAIECYPNQLNQVFINILVNAAQAMPDRGTLTIRTSKVNGGVEIAISDTGVGISSDNLGKIFTPGFTTKEAGIGTGLGLSISYKIIQDHRGRIEVESKVGKGTTFIITLPVF